MYLLLYSIFSDVFIAEKFMVNMALFKTIDLDEK